MYLCIVICEDMTKDEIKYIIDLFAEWNDDEYYVDYAGIRKGYAVEYIREHGIGLTATDDEILSVIEIFLAWNGPEWEPINMKTLREGADYVNSCFNSK